MSNSLKVLVLSDNHGKKATMEKILKEENYQYAIHLGDSQFDESYINQRFDYYVSGNNDYFSTPSKLISINGIKILLIHGHYEGVHMFTNKNTLYQIAKEWSADFLLYGHIHMAKYDIVNNVSLICPGSTDYPRSAIGRTYAILTISDTSVINVEIKKIH